MIGYARADFGRNLSEWLRQERKVKGKRSKFLDHFFFKTINMLEHNPAFWRRDFKWRFAIKCGNRGAKSRNEESFPIDVADHLLVGKNAVEVYRTYRGLTQKQLAEAAGINAAYFSQIEGGRRTGSVRILAAIAEALDINVGSLI